MTYTTKFGDIPDEHLINKDGTMFVRFGGLLWLAGQEGVYRCETREIQSSIPNEIVFECKGWLIPNKKYLEKMGIDPASPLVDMFRMPVITHGTTNADNLRNNMYKFKYVMAETRAIVRNLRIITGCTLCSEDELDTFQYMPSKIIEEAKSAGVLTSASDLLNAKPTEPTTREQFIRAINAHIKENALVVKPIVNEFLGAHNASILANLSDPLLRELYNSVVETLAE